MSSRPRKPLIERVRAIGWTEAVRVPDLGACWEWNGALSPSGYPRIATGGREGSTYVHRVMLAESLGRDLLDGMFACHHCDNRRCVNPDHLHEGTHEDNMRDAVVRGSYKRAAQRRLAARHAMPRGTR